MRTKSLLRKEEYKALSRLTLTGKVLDIGGSKKSGYHELIQGEHQIVTANIDESYGTDLVFDAEKTWPIENEAFDAVLFVNVLEHIYHYREALGEAHRVLKPGGTLAGVVPFMFNVHGSPDDYFRYTASALTRILSDAQFDEIEIQELGCGSFGIVYHALIGFMRWDWLASASMSAAKGVNAFIDKVRPQNRMGKAHMPLGYYFSARKR